MQERPDNPEEYACIVYEDYDRKLVRHFVDHHNQHLYPRVPNQTRLMRWKAGLLGGQPRMPASERELDLCLMKTLKRTVEKRGCINFANLIYTASLSRDEDEHWRYDHTANFLKDYEGRKVAIRYNPTNIIYVLVYMLEENGQLSRFLGTVRARDLQEERLSLKEWEDRKRTMREEGKSIDQSSILAQQRNLYTSSIEKTRTLKQRRKKESKRITRNSKHSNKVVELHPPERSTLHTKVESENVAAATELDTPEIIEFVEEKKIQVQPALYVVDNWDEFVEDGQ